MDHSSTGSQPCLPTPSAKQCSAKGCACEGAESADHLKRLRTTGFEAREDVRARAANRLLLRPGARFECQGDGTCCTHIHVLGPISRAEAQLVRQAALTALPARRQPVVVRDRGIDGLVIAMQGRACVFLDDNARCRIHATVGPSFKPAACKRFPLGATQTPMGVRVTLSHRCACVTVGTSAPMQEANARQVLSSGVRGRLMRDHEVGKRVRWRGRKSVEFEAYAQWERCMIASLDRDDGPAIERVMGMGRPDKLPPLRVGTWRQVADAMKQWCKGEPESDGFFCTLRWVEGAIRHGNGWKGPHPNRPWSWTFERAQARASNPRPERRILGAWLADELWAMQWAARGSVYKAMADMSARYILALRIAQVLRRLGRRKDLATAEAVMVLDTVAAWDSWDKVRRSLDEAAVGTFG